MYKRAILKIISVLCSVAALVVATMTILINSMLYFNSNRDSSVTIIGGADGHTAIFISTNPQMDIFLIGVLFAGIAGAIALYLGRDK